MTHVSHVNDIPIFDQVEPDEFGWAPLDDRPKRTTPKGALFDYHGHELWIAKANCRAYRGVYYAKTWAIESAKQWASAQKEAK